MTTAATMMEPHRTAPATISMSSPTGMVTPALRLVGADLGSKVGGVFPETFPMSRPANAPRSGWSTPPTFIASNPAMCIDAFFWRSAQPHGLALHVRFSRWNGTRERTSARFFENFQMQNKKKCPEKRANFERSIFFDPRSFAGSRFACSCSPIWRVLPVYCFTAVGQGVVGGSCFFASLTLTYLLKPHLQQPQLQVNQPRFSDRLRIAWLERAHGSFHDTSSQTMPHINLSSRVAQRHSRS